MGNEEQMPRVPLPDELLAIIAQRYGLSLGQALIRSYREAGGLCKSEEYLAFIPFIRWRLRQELRRHFALVAHGLPGEPEYAARQLRAFERLRGCHVSFAREPITIRIPISCCG